MNEIARQEIELADYDVTVQHVSLYNTETPSELLVIVSMLENLICNNSNFNWYNQHQVMMTALNSLTLSLSRHPSLSSIALRLHPVYTHSRCMQVFAGQPTLARLCVGVHWEMSLMSSSLHFQQCPAYLVRLIWMVFKIGERWPHSNYFGVCCFLSVFVQDST